MTTATTGATVISSARRRWAVLAVCGLGLYLVGMDTTIVNVGLPSIGTGLGLETRQLEWVVDVYTLFFGGLLISSGAVADRFGRKRVFRVGLTLVGIASLAGAVAPNLGVLLAARAAQGTGASMLAPVGLAIVVNVMSNPRERAQAIGVWASVFGLSMATGPVVGGALVSALGWRSVFWVNTPVVLIALVLSALFVPESRPAHPRALDPLGQLLLGLAVFSAIGVMIEGTRIGFASLTAVALYAVVAITVPWFVRVERRRASPLIEVTLFRRAAFTTAVLGAVAAFLALAGALLMNTLYLQDARGWSPLQAGLAILPMAIGTITVPPLAGWLVGRVGPRVPLLLSGVFLTLGGLSLVELRIDTSPAWLLFGYLLIGGGFGFANPPITNTAVTSLPIDRAGLAGGVTSTARQFGSAIGIALAGGILAHASGADLASATHVGWMAVAACGVFMFVVAAAAAHRSPSSREPDAVEAAASDGV